MPKWIRLVWVGLKTVIAVCAVMAVGIIAYPVVCSGRIYPGVSVQGVDLGGLTVVDATATLVERLPDPPIQGVVLRAEGRSWRLRWADVGRTYDYVATATAAYHVARKGRWHERTLSAWRVRLDGYSIQPLVTPSDPTQVTIALQEVAALVSVSPTDAQLKITSAGVVPVPGQPGKALDVETSAALVIQALVDGAAEVELAMKAVPSRLSEPEPALTLARSLLAQPFTLVVDDPLTDYHADFLVPAERLAAWLRAVPKYGVDDARMALEVEEAAVQAWLLEVAPQLGPDRLLDIGQTVKRTMAALTAGAHQAEGHVRHPEDEYVVQPGDNLFDIAYSHGFPVWRLEEANPDVDPDALAVGQELVIPSIDVLFPEPLVPGKSIEISLPEQRLRAYEDGQLVYDFTCSSGISSTPTIAGQFQVLFKEPSAYAQRWDLEMPHFMAVYQEGPDFFNGIHELPITAGGGRLWAGVLGWPASYGCIILDVVDAQALYDWAPVGTLVRIKGVAPGTPSYEDQ